MNSHSVVLPTKNRSREIEIILGDLVRQTSVPNEIVVLDASADAATEKICADFSSGASPVAVRYIRTASNISGQKNTGIERSSGDIITFFDDDARPDETYCEQVLKRFEQDTETRIAGISGLLINPVYRNPLELMFRKLFLLQSDNGRNTFLSSGFPDTGYAYASETEVEFLASTAVSFRRSAVGDIRFEEQVLTGKPMGLAGGRGFAEDVLFSATIGRTSALLVLPSARFSHHPSQRNRENTFATQSLYIYSLRYISARTDLTSSTRSARYRALFGQALLCLFQSVRYADPGYLRGYIRAMTAPLSRTPKL